MTGPARLLVDAAVHAVDASGHRTLPMKDDNHKSADSRRLMVACDLCVWT